MAKRSRTKEKTQSYANRNIDAREPLPSFLIICEGKKTEPNYFNSFRILTLSVEEFNVIGLGDNTLSLVEKAKDRKENANYDYVWCVFDRDSFPPNQFNAAITSAYSHGMYVAYSNEAFELWYLLHFHFYSNSMSRTSYKRLLTRLLKYKYEKNSTTIYKELRDKQRDAIRNAKNLLNKYDPNRPEPDNPSTTVHLLVQCLNALVTYLKNGSKADEMEKLKKCLGGYHSEVKAKCGIMENPETRMGT